MKRYQKTALLIAVCLGSFLASLDISIVNVALPAIQENLNASLSELQWIINSYAVILAALMLSSSALSDRFGHKKIWLIGVGIFTLGSLICALAIHINLLLLGRAIQGAAGAILIPSAMSLISFAYPDQKERVAAVGIWSAINALALVLGPLLGGILVHYFSWHSIFMINLPIGLLAFFLGLWSMNEHRYPDDAALDPIGQILSIVTLSLLSYALIIMGEKGGWNLVSTLSLISALITFSLFIWVELRVQRPILKLSLFLNRHFSAINFASFILGFASYSSLFFFSVYLQQVHQFSPEETGLRMTPQFLMTGIISFAFGRINNYFSTETLMISGYALSTIAFIGMYFFEPTTNYAWIGLSFGILGIGMGLAVPATGALVMNAVKEKEFARASCAMNSLRQMGMSMGIALLATVMSIRAITDLTQKLNAESITSATEIAKNAVHFHQFPNIQGEIISTHYLTSMNHGFNAAMIIAGLSCLIATIIILLNRSPHL